MDYTYVGYGTGAAYPNYYHGGLNVGFPTFQSMPYLYAPGMIRHRCLPDKQPDSKPRLSKDEVEILEAHFRQNPKPPSSLKRELAERMGVELPRINNWFQNRRAKAKQEKNQEEYKARQAAAAKAGSQTPAPDQASSLQEHFPLSNEQGPLQPCVASFAPSLAGDQVPGRHRIRTEATQEPREAMPQAMSAVTSRGLSPGDSGDDTRYSQGGEGYLPPQPTCRDLGRVLDRAASPEDASHLRTRQGHLVCSGGASNASQTPYGLDSNQPSSAHVEMKTSCASTLDDTTQEIASSEISTTSVASPPAPTKFKSPPPAAEIARRRNRRPLGLSPFSYHGQPSLKTCAGDNSRRSDTTSPIRRIASATGCAPPRIMKPSTGPAPRSPMFSDQKREALLQSLHGPVSPAVGLSVNSAVAAGPPTPRTPLYVGFQDNHEQTSSVASDEDSRSYAYQHSQVASFFKLDDPSIKTPPGTPGVVSFHGRMYPHQATEPTCDYVTSQEEPLFTPGVHGGFPPELDFIATASLAAPDYVAPNGVSQPVTPSFAPPGLAPGCFNEGASGSEYNWPNSALHGGVFSGGSSPTSKSKTFQFTPNMTPQHFSADK